MFRQLFPMILATIFWVIERGESPHPLTVLQSLHWKPDDFFTRQVASDWNWQASILPSVAFVVARLEYFNVFIAHFWLAVSVAPKKQSTEYLCLGVPDMCRDRLVVPSSKSIIVWKHLIIHILSSCFDPYCRERRTDYNTDITVHFGKVGHLFSRFSENEQSFSTLPSSSKKKEKTTFCCNNTERASHRIE